MGVVRRRSLSRLSFHSSLRLQEWIGEFHHQPSEDVQSAEPQLASRAQGIEAKQRWGCLAGLSQLWHQFSFCV